MVSPVISRHCFFFFFFPLALSFSSLPFSCSLSSPACFQGNVSEDWVPPGLVWNLLPSSPNLPRQTNFGSAALTSGHVTTPVPMTTRSRAVDECVSMGNNEHRLKLRLEKKNEDGREPGSASPAEVKSRYIAFQLLRIGPVDLRWPS